MFTSSSSQSAAVLKNGDGAEKIGFKLNGVAGAVRMALADIILEEITPEMFGAVRDGVVDDSDAMDAMVVYAITTPVKMKFNSGIYRVTRSVGVVDCGISLTYIGAGGGQTFLFGDFIGAGDGILDISNSNGSSYSTRGHRVSGIGFLANGVPGDPIGLKAENAFECVVDDIDAPYRGSGIGRTLANSVVVCTNDNNSKWTNIRGQVGYQPRLFSSVTFSADISFSLASTTVAADENIFTAAMVGETIYFSKGSDTGSNAKWSGVIASYTSASEIELTSNAPGTEVDAKCVVGVVKVTVTNGSAVAVLNQDVGADSDWEGMQMHVVGASVKSDAGGNAGVLSTKIVSVAGTSITMAADATVSGEFVCFFCPNVFIGSYESDPATRQTNHSWWVNLHCEGYQAAGLIVNKAIFTNIENLKVHAPAYGLSSDWGEAYCPILLSEIKTLSINGIQSAYCIYEKNCWLVGSRGFLNIDNFEQGHTEKNTPYINCENVTDEFRISVGGLWSTFGYSNFSDSYNPVAVPNSYNHEYNGPLLSRDGKLRALTKSPAVYAPGITAAYQRISISDDGVFTYRPPGNVGTLHFSTVYSTGFAIARYRTSESISGGQLESINLGGLINLISAETVLTGTTGADGKITIAPDADGNLQIENRRGGASYVYICHMPFGDG